MEEENLPKAVFDAVLVESAKLPEEAVVIKGYDFNGGLDYDALLKSYITSGFQAQSFGKAVDIVNNMLKWRLCDENIEEDEQSPWNDPEIRRKTRCKIFLGYTSNLVSSGLREVIKYLVQHKMVDVIVSSAGGIEEDFIKCLGPTVMGDFTLEGAKLRESGLNRIGNLLVPNDNYCKFEDWIMPILDKMLGEQIDMGVQWTPSRMIERLGLEINNEDSIYYWAAKNKIPVYSPAITDGSIGDMLYMHSYRSPGLILDLVKDIRSMNNEAVFAKKTGMIILGGGIVKHHINNANLMRNGADYAVYINTGQEFDGSDAGARPDEAISWGKIKASAETSKVYADATLVFPLLVAQTFAKNFQSKK